jgi:hypothetical protein
MNKQSILFNTNAVFCVIAQAQHTLLICPHLLLFGGDGGEYAR